MDVALWLPARPLRFARMTIDAAQDAVGVAHVGVSLWRGPDPGLHRNLKMLANDVALIDPGVARHDIVASEFVEALGGPVQPWAGTLCVIGIDSPEGGFPQSLTGQQITHLTGIYWRVTGSLPEDVRDQADDRDR